MVYTLMFGNKKVFNIDMPKGNVIFHNKELIPFGLHLDEDETNNSYNFNYWLANRLISLDRIHMKAMLNSLNIKQVHTDKDRAGVVLHYHSVSLQDNYWTKQIDEKANWSDINLFNNSFSKSIFDVSLLGRNLTVDNKDLITQDLNLAGRYPKAWKRINGKLFLFKANNLNGNEVDKEVISSKTLNLLGIPHLSYWKDTYKENDVSICKCITKDGLSIVSAEDLEVWCENNDTTLVDFVKKLDLVGYHYMNIADYLLGNTDRHKGNWGILVNENNNPLKLHPLFDFNNSFNVNEGDSTPCLPEDNKITQLQAATEGVKFCTINFNAKIAENMFLGGKDYENFMSRLALLREAYNNKTKLNSFSK